MTSRTLTEIAELCGADLDGDGARKVVGPSSLVDAEEHHVSFFSDPRYRGQLVSTKAAGVLVPTGFELDEELKRQISGEGGRDLTLLRVEDPSGAFTTVIESFAAPLSALPVGAHPSALVDESAKIGEGVAIGPNVVIGPHVVLEDNVILHAGVFVGEATCIGRSTVCHPNVTLYPRTVLGAKCILHAGVVVGSDGFGFEPTAEGWDKIPQCGSVEVEDDVEIGAGSTIDRGRFGATRIGRGVKLDNLVHVAHNVVLGEATLLCAQVGIAGSSTLGKRVIMGGQAGAGGHLTIADGVSIGGGGGVIGDIAESGEYLGWPARPRRETFKRLAAQNKVPDLMKRLRSLEERLRKLEGESS